MKYISMLMMLLIFFSLGRLIIIWDAWSANDGFIYAGDDMSLGKLYCEYMMSCFIHQSMENCTIIRAIVWRKTVHLE